MSTLAKINKNSILNLKDLSLKLNLLEDEWNAFGKHVAKIDFEKVLKRTNIRKAKFIVVTGMTPTKFGEGKTTTTIGLVQGLGKLNKQVTGAIRQPSSGPTFNLKGSGGGGGKAQCVPLESLSIKLTGDIDCITNAHNLAMVALTSRLQHESNYDDKKLKELNLERLNIDPENVEFKWAMDFCAQSLRNIEIGHGGKMDGFRMKSGFQITSSSELMTILCLSKNLKDMVDRISKIVVAFDKEGNKITTKDLEVDGAMTAWMSETLKPNLLQTIEGQPLLVHGGPFANISLGQSSIIADNIGLSLSDYHVTECGFGSDIGFEKFCNIKCRISNNLPDCVVIVSTLRAIKYLGEKKQNTQKYDVLINGLSNLFDHIEIVKLFGLSPIVCINKFEFDNKDELDFIKKLIEEKNISCVLSTHYLEGGNGATELAKAVVEHCKKDEKLKYLYEDDLPMELKIKTVAQKVYGAQDIEFSNAALKKLKNVDTRGFYPCIAKSQYSISHDEKVDHKGVWVLPINDVLVFEGAKLIVPVTGNIKLMPGTGSLPSFRNIKVNVNNSSIEGLF